jgi:hypothetical protein
VGWRMNELTYGLESQKGREPFLLSFAAIVIWTCSQFLEGTHIFVSHSENLILPFLFTEIPFLILELESP